MGDVVPAGAERTQPETEPAVERRDEAIRSLMDQIRESVEILRSLRAK